MQPLPSKIEATIRLPPIVIGEAVGENSKNSRAFLRILRRYSSRTIYAAMRVIA